MSGSLRRLGRVTPKTSVLFLCDMQEKFRQSIQYFPQVISVSNRMLKGAEALDIPIIVTEQYKKGTAISTYLPFMTSN